MPRSKMPLVSEKLASPNLHHRHQHDANFEFKMCPKISTRGVFYLPPHQPTHKRHITTTAATCSMSSPLKISLHSKQPFQGNVRKGASDLLIDNAPFSRFYHITVSTPENRPLYDLAALAEPAGAIALALNKSGKIALLKQYRPIPAKDPADHTAFTKLDPALHGFTSLEVPRGFPEEGESYIMAAAREVREETGFEVLRSESLGWCNFNTAIVMTDIPIVACLVGKHVGADCKPAESIEEVLWVDVDELAALVSRGEIRCGMTLSTVAYLLADRAKIEKFVKGDR